MKCNLEMINVNNLMLDILFGKKPGKEKLKIKKLKVENINKVDEWVYVCMILGYKAFKRIN